MGNVSKRQKPDQRADNSRRQPMDLQSRENLPQPRGLLQLNTFIIKLTFWKIQSCGNVLETSNLISSTLDSLLDGGSEEAEIKIVIYKS